jgi:hypothetical protein
MIAVGSMFECRRCSMYVTPIKYTNGILEERPEFGVLVNSLENFV